MNARFFSNVQDAPWYTHFLNPVLGNLANLDPHATILDVGTGAGRLIELGQMRTHHHWIGADTSADMLAEARRRPHLQHTPLHNLSTDGKLPLDNESVDAVVYCSVLFLLPNPERLLDEAWRVLRAGGRVVVLTPSGEGKLPTSILRNIGIHPNNWTFLLWRNMTAGQGRAWSQRHVLQSFAKQHHATYQRERVFYGLAYMETMGKPMPVTATV
jgi:ubiquinone/menaquinone biosynthesis C-methylase UbiE